MHHPQAPALETPLNSALGDTNGEQLSLSHHPVLLVGKSHDLPFLPNPLPACLTSPTHMGG
jgi:hypothetical protein